MSGTYLNCARDGCKRTVEWSYAFWARDLPACSHEHQVDVRAELQAQDKQREAESYQRYLRGEEPDPRD